MKISLPGKKYIAFLVPNKLKELAKEEKKSKQNKNQFLQIKSY